MTAAATLTGAPSTSKIEWVQTDWTHLTMQVRRLQTRIAKAIREKRHNKAKALQWLLTHSFAAKLLAVKRVTQNRNGGITGSFNWL